MGVSTGRGAELCRQVGPRDAEFAALIENLRQEIKKLGARDG